MTTPSRISFIGDDATTTSIDPRLLQCLLGALFLGVIAMLSLPAARVDSAALGWMPLWLLGMPLASLGALAALHAVRLRLPRRRMPDSSAAMWRRRSGTVQARRRGADAKHPLLSRAA
jgi:hypothetical protein